MNVCICLGLQVDCGLGILCCQMSMRSVVCVRARVSVCECVCLYLGQ